MGSDVMGGRPKDEEEDSVWCCVKMKGCWTVALCCFVV